MAVVVITLEGERHRVLALDPADVAVQGLSMDIDTGDAARAYAAGLRMVTGCAILDLTAREVD